MEKLDIKVATITNGYTLNVKGREHMYFTLPKLMMGIAQHCQNEIDKENCEYFAEALGSHTPPTDFLKQEARKLEARIRNAERDRNRKEEELKEEKEKVKELQKQNRNIEKELAKAKKEIEKMKKNGI